MSESMKAHNSGRSDVAIRGGEDAMSQLDGLGAFAYRQRVRLLVVFVLVFVVCGVVGAGTARRLVAGGFEDPGSESSRATVALDSEFGLGSPDVLVAYSHASSRVRDSRFEEALAPRLARIASMPGVAHVSTPYGDEPDALVSRDRRTTVIGIVFDARGRRDPSTFEGIEPILRVPGLTALIGGTIPGAEQAQQAAEDDLVRAEWVTLPLVAILLVAFFRGFVLAAMPLLVGGFAVASALACLRLLTHVTDVSVSAMNIVTFIGLGVAIDYSLFMTSRFRDELAEGRSVEEATRYTLMTAGRTIAYSGCAVAVSLLAMAAFPIMLLQSIAIAGSIVVLMALVASLLFLPAMLAMLGPLIERGRLGGNGTGVLIGPRAWRAIANGVMRAPLIVTIAVTALLLLLGAPFTKLRSSVSGASALPHDAEARLVADLLGSSRFRRDAVMPTQILVTTDARALDPTGLESIAAYADALERIPGVDRVDSIVGGSKNQTPERLLALLESPAGRAVATRLASMVRGHRTAILVRSDVEPESDEATSMVRRIRAIRVPGVHAMVTSPAARLADLRTTLNGRLPFAIAIVCIATFVVLFLAFGSMVMPIKAIIMNVLSLSASFGALVFIFQEGRFETLLGFRSPGSIDLMVPIVMFSVVFGLAMDYELFLLSRVREAYDESGDTHQSVTLGLERTGQLITRAALLLIAVMVGFMTADMLLVKELGVGMAIAVAIDATIVRALLVPATMQLLGKYNWWSPAPIARWWSRTRLGVDERAPSPSP